MKRMDLEYGRKRTPDTRKGSEEADPRIVFRSSLEEERVTGHELAKMASFDPDFLVWGSDAG